MQRSKAGPRAWPLGVVLLLLAGCSATDLARLGGLLDGPSASARPTLQASGAPSLPPVVGALPQRSPGPTPFLNVERPPSVGLEPGVAPSVPAGPPDSVAPVRHSEDQPDDESGYQVHVLYAFPREAKNQDLDTDGSIERSVFAANAWFHRQTQGRQKFRLDTVQGRLDITHVALPESDEELRAFGLYQRDAIETSLKRLGYKQAKKLYAVYYEGSHGSTCGDGPSPPGLPGNVVVLYLRRPSGQGKLCIDNRLSPDGQAFGYLEASFLHELVHALGFVQACAPHRSQGAHTSYAPGELMYSGDLPWRFTDLDSAREIYEHGRAGCLDLADSAFLTPQSRAAAPPPDWAKAITRIYP